MPSFDIVSKVDSQTLDNVVNVARKEITNRFDFKDTQVSIELNKKDLMIDIESESEMKINQIADVMISRAVKHGLDPLAFDFNKEPVQSGKIWKKHVQVQNGLKPEDAKKIVKIIKDSGMKVQAQIMDDLVRVTGKKIDDLQQIIAVCKTSVKNIPLQYLNFRN